MSGALCRSVDNYKSESTRLRRREAQMHAEKGRGKGKVVVRVNA